MEPARWLVLGALVAVSVVGCMNDYDQFDLNGGQAGSSSGGSSAASGGGTAGESGAAGVAGSTAGTGAAAGSGGASGGSAGAAGTGGGSGSCGGGMKPCGQSCVSVDDPQTGCAQASCDPCAVPHATAACAAGVCSVGTCTSPYANCNASATDGCETDLSKPSNTSCGSCLNNCTQQGWTPGFSCGVNLICRCTGPEQCREGGSGTAGCAADGHCVCETTECNAGERCRKQGSSQLCSCNGGAACVPGQTCCQTPSGCKDLQTDAQNCGACGRACPTGTQCVTGNCQ